VWALVLVGVFVVLLVLAVIGRFNLWPSPLPDPLVSGEVDKGEMRRHRGTR